MWHRLTGLLAGVLALALMGSPAFADTQQFADGTSTEGAMDISSVTVKNERQLVISIRVDDLQRQVGLGTTVWFDTKAGRAGPEFVVESGLYESDWQIFRARNWQIVGNGPLPCSISQHLDEDREIIRYKTGPSCLGKYARVRVSVTTEDDDGIKDYSPLRRTFHPWVARY